MRKVPKLRFKEFSDEWEEKKLGKIGKFFSGGTPLTSKKEYYDGNIPFIKSGEISEENTEQTISEEGLKNSSAKLVKKGELLLALYGATSGEVAISKIDGAINQAVLNIKTSENNLFLYNYFKLKKESILTKYLQGGQGNLSAEIIKNLFIFFPSLQEQQKIANFLSSIDKKISLTEEKLELFREYKKGVMQKIFSQELRFKDNNGNDYPEWEEKRLGDILNIGNGRNYRHLEKGEIPVYGTGGIIERVNNYLYEGESVFIGRKGTINKPVYYNGKFWTVDTLFYTYNFVNILPKFLYYTFCNIDWLSYNEATGVPSLSKATILKIENKIPSIQEQQKIADFLSSIDSKIESIEKELEGLKEFKKGLLQQMFV